MTFTNTMQLVGNTIDTLGVMIILFGIIGVTIYFLRYMISNNFMNAYNIYRQGLGRVILLGLEFLVAGDIIRTVAVSPTLQNVAVLAGIVIIRTLLSMALQMEVEGRWPWQK
jgi:uncharacterized membrane protein